MRKLFAAAFAAAVLLATALLSASLLAAFPARGSEHPACAAALVLLLDVSSSVDDEEYAAQRDGTAAAFRDPAIARIIETQPGGVAVTAIEWGNDAHTTVPWTVLRTAEDAASFATALATTTRSDAGETYMGHALDAANSALDAAPCAAEREVVDVSGDGESTDRWAKAVETLAARGATVNALAVPEPKKPWLPEWFRENVATPGGFVIEAPGYGAYGPAIRRKLVLELAAR